MKKAELEKWLLDNDQTDSWYVAFGEEVSEEPYALMEINRRALVNGNNEIYVLHSSKAHLDEPPWMGFEPTQETILRKTPPVKKMSQQRTIPLNQQNRISKSHNEDEQSQTINKQSSSSTDLKAQSGAKTEKVESTGVISLMLSKIFDMIKAAVLITVVLFAGSTILTNESLPFILKLLYANLFLFSAFYALMLLFTTKRIRKNLNRWLISA